MEFDSDIENDVENELEWSPHIDAEDIAVNVEDGTVELAGFVKHYSDEVDAEAAARKVAGVVAVANDIQVRVPDIDERPDPDIARDAALAIGYASLNGSTNIKTVDVIGSKASASPKGFGRSPTMAFPGAAKNIYTERTRHDRRGHARRLLQSGCALHLVLPSMLERVTVQRGIGTSARMNRLDGRIGRTPASVQIRIPSGPRVNHRSDRCSVPPR